MALIDTSNPEDSSGETPNFIVSLSLSESASVVWSTGPSHFLKSLCLCTLSYGSCWVASALVRGSLIMRLMQHCKMD